MKHGFLILASALLLICALYQENQLIRMLIVCFAICIGYFFGVVHGKDDNG